MHEEGYSAEDAQQQVVRKVFQQVAQRPDSFCNYLEGSIPQWGADTKLIYRHYATLYFVFAVDELESDLGILDLIQVFVEALDKCFENVCELDLIFLARTCDDVELRRLSGEARVGESCGSVGVG